MFGDCCESAKVDACGVCNGDGSTCKVIAYIAEPVETTGFTEIIYNISLADDSCDLVTPCMHLNDGHCMPKTVNSAILTGDEHHCYWDRDANASAQPNWKYGTWNEEGRLSRSIETQYENGNKDCYCAAGTVDITKKLEVEEKAKEDFVQTVKDKVDDIVSTAPPQMPTEKVTYENSYAAVAYDTAGCSGKYIEMSSIYNNILCGKHWRGTDGVAEGKGNCACAWAATCAKANHKTCANDKVRSIMLPPMTTAKLYKHCNNNFGSSKQIRYPSLENFGTTAKCINLPLNDDGKSTYDTSNIVIEGNVLKVDAKVVGTEADCMETKCMSYVEACRLNDKCAEVLTLAEQLVTKGANFIPALKELAESDVGDAFKHLFTCAGKAQMQCSPDIAVTETVKTSKTTNTTSKAKIMPANYKIQPTSQLIMSQLSSGSSFFERRRLTAGAGSTAVVQVSSSGNQGVVGSATSSAASAGQFATGASPASSTAGGTSAVSHAGVGTAGAVGVAIGCTAIAALAIAFIIHQKSNNAPVSNAGPSNPTTLAKGTTEDHTDVL
jgi:hypothetical protein